MGCLLKTLEKGFIRLDKNQPKKKKPNNNQNKSKNKNKKNIPEKIDEIDDKEINIDKIDNNNNINKKHNSIIKNRDNYYKREQLDYYINLYLPNNIQINLKENLNYKK